MHSNEGTGTDKKAQGSRPTPSDLRLFLIRHPPIGGRAKASDRRVREVCNRTGREPMTLLTAGVNPRRVIGCPPQPP